MRKTLAAGTLVVLVVGVVRAGGPTVQPVAWQQYSVGTAYLMPKSLPSVPTDAILPAPETVAPAPAPAAVPEPPTAATVPAVPPVPEVSAVPNGSPIPCGCAGCGRAGHPHHFSACLHRLIEWATYCPLKRGVNCESCTNNDSGGCCRYHCYPPLYLFFMDYCVEGHVPSPHCGCGGCCGHGAPMAAGPAPDASGTEYGGTKAAPSTESPSLSGDGSGSSGEHTSFFGTRRRLPLFGGLSRSSVDAH
jgi:hypothetical protein